MPSAGPILDYASPRPRGRLRLPAKSLISWNIESNGSATIVETLAGKDTAVFAIIFALFILIAMSPGAIAELSRWMRHPSEWWFLLLLVGLAVAEIVVMILVVDQTWAKTTIRATRDQLTFASRSPLRGRQYAWNAREVAYVSIVPTQDLPDAAPLAEIEISVVDHPVIKLFTDHLTSDLTPVAQAILHGLGRAEPPIDDERPIETPLLTHLPDEKTLNRLVEAHREMRGRHAR